MQKNNIKTERKVVAWKKGAKYPSGKCLLNAHQFKTITTTKKNDLENIFECIFKRVRVRHAADIQHQTYTYFFVWTNVYVYELVFFYLTTIRFSIFFVHIMYIKWYSTVFYLNVYYFPFHHHNWRFFMQATIFWCCHCYGCYT